MKKVLCFFILIHCLVVRGHTQVLASSGTRHELSPDIAQQFRIGTEYFLNRDDTPEHIDRQFSLMHEAGLSLVRVFIIWNDVERRPGRWNFTRYDWIYSAAAKYQLKVIATLCAEDPPAWTGLTPFYHNRVNLNAPQNRRRAENYIHRVVAHYRSHPAQAVWLLMNEPSRYDQEPATFRVFGKWLESNYGNVEALNDKWFRPVKRFSQVTLTGSQLDWYWTDYLPIIDWREFNIDNLVDQLQWIRREVTALDTAHPVHINVTMPTGGAHGQDGWKEASAVDILGASMHPVWHFPPNTSPRDFGVQYAMRADLIASAAGPRPWWVTELQSGPALFTGLFSLNPSPSELTQWLWDSYGAGSKAVVFWLWNPRIEGTEAGEWGLVTPEGMPTARVTAIKAFSNVFAQNPELNFARPQRTEVAILYNREAEILDSLDDRTQHRGDLVEASMMGCYMALHRSHIPVSFIDLDQLKAGQAASYKVLYLPYSYSIDEPSMQALRRYVDEGGTIVADGLFGWKTERGFIRGSVPGTLHDVFGMQVPDITPVPLDEPYSITSQDEKGGELWMAPISLQGARPTLIDTHGRIVAVEHPYGRGKAIYFAPAVTLAYRERSNPIVRDWIADPARPTLTNLAVRLDSGNDSIAFRGLTSPAASFAIVSNWSSSDNATVSFAGRVSVEDVTTGTPIPSSYRDGRTLVRVDIRGGDVRILRGAPASNAITTP